MAEYASPVQLSGAPYDLVPPIPSLTEGRAHRVSRRASVQSDLTVSHESQEDTDAARVRTNTLNRTAKTWDADRANAADWPESDPTLRV